MFRIPFAMPPAAISPEASEDEEDEVDRAKTKGYSKGGIPGVAAKVKAKVAEKHSAGATTQDNARMPGLTPGNPTWYDQELEEREALPESSPSGHGKDGPMEPYQHFELLRNAQKEWW